MAVTLGSAVGGTMGLEDDYVAVTNRGKEWLVDPDYAPPFLYAGLVPSSLASEVALKFGAQGPAVVVSTGCTSGIDALGYGHQLIQDGEADIVIAGASDSPISPISMACFDAIKATSPRNDDPEHASRPFDADRDGFVMGEGGAVLVLEEHETAQARGAHIYCEIAGFATRGNAYHMTGLRPEAYEMAEAISDALHQGGTNPEDIDYVNAHGSGTKQNDRHETAAFKSTLGEHAYKIPISSIKSMVGHSLGAIGAIEIAACALAIDRGVVPPTANYETRDPECDLDYTPKVARAEDGLTRALHGQRLRRLPVRHDLLAARGAEGGGRLMAEPESGVFPAQTTVTLPDASQRAVITGLGVVAPNGIGTEAVVEGDAEGRRAGSADHALRPDRYATQLAGEVDGFDADDYIEQRLLVQTDRWTWMALAATQMALDDAGFDPADHDP